VSHVGAQPAQSKPGRFRTIACLSTAPWNPYLRLLYEHLAAHGFELAGYPKLSLRSLWRSRAGIGFLHFHWPESFYRYGRGPVRLRPVLSQVKLLLFRCRLRAARLLGYRLVWTVHQVFPHESLDRERERRGARILARACHLLIVHDAWTAEHVRGELGAPSTRVAIVPHGSYIGVYPEGRPRPAVRRELGVAENSFVFLCFGELREYKEIDLLLAAFASAPLPEARLVVAGNAKNESIGAAVRSASASDARILDLLGFLREERVAELFGACDAAVLPRGEPGTSGSLILALSLGLPVVAADVPTARELIYNGQAGWLFRPRDVASLRKVLESAATDPAGARARGRSALEIAGKLEWGEAARRLALLLTQVER
jgi:beta-1,4-mannosyltransferase